LVIELFKKVVPKLSLFIYTIPKKICYFLELQLFITILALPIFLSWGLPISILSPIGNLIFAPWLTTFLTLSSLIFFMQIIAVENSFVIYALEKLNQLFFAVLNLADKSFMISCPCPKMAFLLLIPIGLFGIIKLKWSSNIYLRVLKLFIFSSLLFLSLKYVAAPADLFVHITNKSKDVLLIKHGSKNTLVDFGALSEGRSAQSWARFQLIPELLKSGIDHVDCLIIPKPSSKVFESILEITKNIDVGHFYIQEWSGLVPYTGWKCWKSLLELKKNKQIAITLLKTPLTIKLNKNFVITVNPTEKCIHKGPLYYKELEIKATLTNKTLNLQNECIT